MIGEDSQPLACQMIFLRAPPHGCRAASHDGAGMYPGCASLKLPGDLLGLRGLLRGCKDQDPGETQTLNFLRKAAKVPDPKITRAAWAL